MLFLVDFPRLIQKIVTIGIWGLIFFILIYTLAFILRVYKLKLIFKGLDREINYSTSYFSTGASFLIYDSTPGKLGDIAKIFIIRDEEGRDVKFDNNLLVFYLSFVLVGIAYLIIIFLF